MVNYFDYASVDFLIDKNGTPVFMEVNDNTLAPYYIEQKNLLIEEVLTHRSELVNYRENHIEELLSCFDKHFQKPPSKAQGIAPKIAIVCKNKVLTTDIDKEIKYLAELFCEHGYEAGVYVPEELEIRQGYLYVKGENICPSIIFRRNFSYPPSGIKQPVINDLIVRKIAGNKYWTHQVVEQLINSCKVEFRQPQTYIIKNQADLIQSIQSFFKQGNDCVAKPNQSYGGDGFFYFDKEQGIESSITQDKIQLISKRLTAGEEYLIQEKIEASLFESADNNKYYFDLRLMVYGGKYTAIEGRRSNKPFNQNCICEKSLVTNIKSGGIDILVAGIRDKHCYYKTEQLLSLGQTLNSDFQIDSNFLILGGDLFAKLKRSSEAIVKIIDEAVSKSKESMYGEKNRNSNYDIG